NARQLALLDFKWEDGVHDGRPTVHVDDLTCNEAGLLHAQERHGVADVFRGSEPSHRRPPALVPGSRGLLDVLRQSAQNTTLDYVGGAEDAAGADAVDRDQSDLWRVSYDRCRCFWHQLLRRLRSARIYSDWRSLDFHHFA